MEERRKDARREPVIVDLEALVPEDHLLRKIERVMDYEWLYALLSPYYCHDNGRPGIDPVVLIKMVLIQIVLPAVVTLGVSEFMRKKDWIKMGDMKLEF